jgi:protein involved in polysaccharide export with SLBB domain
MSKLKDRGIRGLLVNTLLICALLPVFIAGAQEKPYLIGPNDVLTIIIYAGGQKQHESDLTVSVSGKINAPFIGDFSTK